MSLSTSVLFPVPGGPVTPRTNAFPPFLSRAASRLSNPRPLFSTRVIALAIASLFPSSTCLTNLAVPATPPTAAPPSFVAQEWLTLPHRFALPRNDLSYFRASVRSYYRFHLHRLYRDQRGARLHLVAFLHVNRDDQSRERREQ